jgi:hypothetical protein
LYQRLSSDLASTFASFTLRFHHEDDGYSQHFADASYDNQQSKNRQLYLSTTSSTRTRQYSTPSLEETFPSNSDKSNPKYRAPFSHLIDTMRTLSKVLCQIPEQQEFRLQSTEGRQSFVTSDSQALTRAKSFVISESQTISMIVRGGRGAGVVLAHVVAGNRGQTKPNSKCLFYSVQLHDRVKIHVGISMISWQELYEDIIGI